MSYLHKHTLKVLFYIISWFITMLHFISWVYIHPISSIHMYMISLLCYCVIYKSYRTKSWNNYLFQIFFTLQNFQAVDYDLVLFTFLLLTRRLLWGLFQEVSHTIICTMYSDNVHSVYRHCIGKIIVVILEGVVVEVMRRTRRVLYNKVHSY